MEDAVVVRIETLNERAATLPSETETVVGPCVGRCLDEYAPDPREGATFRVTVLSTNAKQVPQ